MLPGRAPNVIRFLVSGEDRIIRKLKRLPKKDARRIIRKASRSAAKSILPTAKSNAPVKTGQLRKSIKVRSIKKSRTSIGVRLLVSEDWYKGDEFYGAFQEFGWKQGKRGTSGRKQIEGSHYMERAFEAKSNAARNLMLVQITKGIEEAVKR
jgi:HK97 gp10 family phage protein